MTLPLLLAAALFAQTEPATTVEVGLGGLGVGTTFQGGRWGGASGLGYAFARHGLGRLSVEGELATTLPLGDGPTLTTQVQLRAGYRSSRFGVWAGPSLQLAPSAQPAWLVLPTLRARLTIEPVTLHLGVFDLHGLAPAHLSASFRDFTLGYVAPLGVRAAYRWARAQPVTFEALYTRLGPVDTLLVTAAVAFTPEAAR
jgi:hypothetical protein